MICKKRLLDELWRFAILLYCKGMVLLLPDINNPNFMDEVNGEKRHSVVVSAVESLLSAYKCETIEDLNILTEKGKLHELIRLNEALHEMQLSQISEGIVRQRKKMVMLAGPSASGKTTTANRLVSQLQSYGMKPILISLDDYYIERRQLMQGCNEEIDFEHIDAIDVPLYRNQMGKLLGGETVTIPHFDFITGCRQYTSEPVGLGSNSVLIVEGIHGLNPVLRPSKIAEDAVFKVFVIPVLPLNLNGSIGISSVMLRLIRRIARDFRVRGASVKKTLSMWGSVRNGEKHWVFPYCNNVDVIFNSATLYELAVLKKQVNPLLLQMQPGDVGYADSLEALKILEHVSEADVDDGIPSSSIVREFIGGSRYL